jgi:hypothetical protein
MNKDALKENHATLVNIMNLGEETSRKILDSSILITGSTLVPAMAEYLKNLLDRTFENVFFESCEGYSYSCEIIIGDAKRRSNGPFVFVGQTNDGALVTSCRNASPNLSKDTHNFLLFFLSCYTSALVLKTIIGEGIPMTISEEIIIDKKNLLKEPQIFTTEINLDTAYLAGAGAIGNSFLYALSTFKVKGEITIADPDFVSGGNLNRCLFFREEDINQKKVDVLVREAQKVFPQLKLVPFPHELGKIALKNENPIWLKKLIVGVDSRRARRTLQSEIPGEVFDASTTGITEIVVHHHKQPLNGKACMGCIYYKEAVEHTHEKHVAELLGISIEQVNQLFIDESAASAIALKYAINPSDIVGQSYDTLFKQFCGEGKLKTVEDQQVLAPLAFVSGIAGALLALKLVEAHLGFNDYNYWRVSPWTNPNYRLQRIYPVSEKCEFCNNTTFVKIAHDLWAYG